VGDRKRILVVDDQEEIRDLVAAVLAGEGFEVVTAEDGRRALLTAFREPFDLVLLDINMPDMDGWETLRLLKADDGLRGTPVVMFSIRGEIRSKVQGMQFGAIGYITKPFAVDELVAGVRAAQAGQAPRSR